ncbi:MAG TPA: hypothetical protein VHB99_18230 [Pirellulales bacterium]|nr:hypothetical protein [Pirellulales bacterium]
MAVEFVHLLTKGRSGSADSKGVTGYSVTFQVGTNNVNDGVQVVGTAVDPVSGFSIPIPGLTIYQYGNETDVSAVCETVTPHQLDESPFVWEVAATFSNVAEPGQENPLDRPAEINVTSQKYEIPVIRDLAGKGIVNTAGNPFDPPVTKDATRYVLTISKNFADYDFDLATDYADSINDLPFMGREAGTLKISGFSAIRRYEQQQIYWTVTWEFEYRREGWQITPLNAGLYKKALPNALQRPCLDQDGSPVTSPVPLDNQGEQIKNPTVDNVVYLAFDVYTPRNFYALNVP